MQEPTSATAPPGAMHVAEVNRLSIFVRKLLLQSRLSTIDQEQLAELPAQIRDLPAQATILREGDHANVCPILLSGIAYRYKIAADGGRQIVSLRIPGDPLDFQSLYLRTIDHHMQSLTPVTLALVPLQALERLAETRPSIARAILVDILIEASIGREWQLNIGRRQALPRLAHFLCEYVHRNRLIVPQLGEEVDIPITQEQLADILGLTPVHINRTLKTLDQAGAVVRSKRRLAIRDLTALERLADFSPVYLHRENAG
jgi:CRP-like cAMP-binding protein